MTEGKSGHAPYLMQTVIISINRLLVKFGVKKTTLVAWVGAERLLSAYFGMMAHVRPRHERSELLLPPEPHQYTSFMLLIDIGCCNPGLKVF